MLRSSPTLEGRCCNLHQSPEGELRILVAILTDPGGPVLRSWPRLPHSPTAVVAILTDPGGPVLHGQERVTAMGGVEVAILTDPGGPVLPPRAGPTRGRTRRCCDPHRPWRAGAAMRQWTDEIARQLRVAILTDPGGPVLRPPRCWPTCPRVIGCDPHRPWRAGAAIAAQCDKLGPCKSALRSSPTLEGRCCTGRSSTWTPPGRRCDPHRPWRAGAAWCEHVGNPERRKLRSSPTLEGRCCRLG